MNSGQNVKEYLNENYLTPIKQLQIALLQIEDFMTSIEVNIRHLRFRLFLGKSSHEI